MERKNVGPGSGQAFPTGDDLTVLAGDRRQEAQETQRQAIPEGDSDVLRHLLDGEAIRHKDGFHCVTRYKQMFIPYSRTRCPAEALRIALIEGVISAKLEALAETAGAILLATTLSREQLDN